MSWSTATAYVLVDGDGARPAMLARTPFKIASEPTRGSAAAPGSGPAAGQTATSQQEPGPAKEAAVQAGRGGAATAATNSMDLTISMDLTTQPLTQAAHRAT